MDILRLYLETFIFRGIVRAFNIADLFELTASCVPDRTALVAGSTRGQMVVAWAYAAALHGTDR